MPWNEDQSDEMRRFSVSAIIRDLGLGRVQAFGPGAPGYSNVRKGGMQAHEMSTMAPSASRENGAQFLKVVMQELFAHFVRIKLIQEVYRNTLSPLST